MDIQRDGYSPTDIHRRILMKQKPYKNKQFN